MIFNEIYSVYYQAVAKIIAYIIDGKTDEKILNQVVRDHAFGESVLTVLPSLKNEKWQLVRKDRTTPIQHKPTMPLTLMEKQWLKAISLDPRMKLFGVTLTGLEEVEPLFTPDDYVIYDKYSDGDPYEDEKYRKHFRTILLALKTKQNIKIEMVNRKGQKVYTRCIPERLEYSEKDDKFRVVVNGCHFIRTINLARILQCELDPEEIDLQSVPAHDSSETVILKIHAERNTLERCMLHFAHFEKRAEKLDNHYLLHIKFQRDDEAEMVIRVLSFGPMVEVLEPKSFRKLIVDKLKSQKSCERI